MVTYQKLRRWIYRFRRDLREKNRKTYSWISGLPRGSDQSELDAIIHQHFSEHITTVSHQHLSGWKSSGAYRIRIKTTSGKYRSVIFKNAVYQQEEIPALTGFPLTPGPPEYAIYSQAAGAFTAYLPRIYMAEEVTPGIHYRYILEDLGENYRSIKGDHDKFQVAFRLPALHEALAEWARAADRTRLLQYGQEFSARLNVYARTWLERFWQQSDLPILSEVLREWPQIVAFHLDPELQAGGDQIIHGDSNYTNFHVGVHDPKELKVVDWEWAGFGSPFADLVSLNKGSLPEIEEKSFQAFASTRGIPDVDLREHWRRYQWCILERSLIDASFLSAQFLGAPRKARVHLPDAIVSALRRLRASYQNLQNEPNHFLQR